MKTYYALKCDMLHADKLTVKPDENSVATVVIHTDALAAVSSARADALRWVLGRLEPKQDTKSDCAVCDIYNSGFLICLVEVRTIIEKELNQ